MMKLKEHLSRLCPVEADLSASTQRTIPSRSGVPTTG